jgi:2-C-methyl-D-erythritol 4-phosphate cytidylyltransferase
MEAPGRPRKQFRELGGAPLLVQTLRVLERHAAVDAIVVAGPPGEEADLEYQLRAAGLSKLQQVVAGGETRQGSVGRALAVVATSTDVVLVHDAVRPFLPAERLSAVIEAARESGAAALAIPMADTVRRGEGGTFGATVPREGLWRMQTPQAFRLDVLREAHARIGDVEGTDEVELVRRMGREVRIVEGSSLNLKVTTSDDWALAEAMWPAWSGEL